MKNEMKNTKNPTTGRVSRKRLLSSAAVAVGVGSLLILLGANAQAQDNGSAESPAQTVEESVHITPAF